MLFEGLSLGSDSWKSPRIRWCVSRATATQSEATPYLTRRRLSPHISLCARRGSWCLRRNEGRAPSPSTDESRGVCHGRRRAARQGPFCHVPTEEARPARPSRLHIPRNRCWWWCRFVTPSAPPRHETQSHTWNSSNPSTLPSRLTFCGGVVPLTASKPYRTRVVRGGVHGGVGQLASVATR